MQRGRDVVDERPSNDQRQKLKRWNRHARFIQCAASDSNPAATSNGNAPAKIALPRIGEQALSWRG
jgi:hypothetical protein